MSNGPRRLTFVIASLVGVLLLSLFLVLPGRRKAAPDDPVAGTISLPAPPGRSTDDRAEDEPAPAGKSDLRVGAAQGPGRVDDPPEVRIAALLSEPHDLSDPTARAELVAELKRLEDLRAGQVRAKAAEVGLPLLTAGGAQLAGFEGEVPLYEISHNAGVATSIGTDLVREAAPFFPAGLGGQIGLWDVYWGPTTSHVELPGVILKDDAVDGGLHSSHMAGTLAAVGIDPQARGMAPEAEVWSFSSSDVLSEIAAFAAQGANDLSGLFVSVHPYGVASGWEYDGEQWYGAFSNDGNDANDLPIYLGQYGSSTSSWDGTVSNFPFHLIVKSAGNHADDDAPAPGATWYLNGSSPYTYVAGSHPKSDGAQYSKPGYGTIDSRASAKNVLTVGSTSKAMTAGGRDPGAAVLSNFSSMGPTDDGRIKPDLMGMGEDVYSADGGTTNSYLRASGTSMASAGVAGSAQLLQEMYLASMGEAMRASTLKGLLIHSADDLELPGPDYRTGWGLANLRAAADLLEDHAAAQPLDRIKQKEVSISNPRNRILVNIDGTGPVRLTMCWTDLAGQWTNSHDNRTPRLVNDLNLRLESLDGWTVYYPYVMPFTSTWAAGDLDAPATTGVNTVDNVEQIYVEAPAAGSYRIVVDYAGTLQGGAQKYSLLATGTYLGLDAVEVATPVADQSYLLEGANPITVADVNTVFTGSGHQYRVTWTPEGILTASIDAAGNVTVVPTMNSYGAVELTLTADDGKGGTAETSFTVSLLSNIVRVDASSVAPVQHGGTWEAAYAHLRDALAVALPGQEIWVADGVYYPDARAGGDSDARTETFLLTNGVRLFGGFTGAERFRSERNPNSRATILSGDIRQDDSQQPIASCLLPVLGDSTNSYRVVTIARDASATLDGFVVTAGRNTDLLNPHGAGIYVASGASAMIANCLVTGNQTNGRGGGLMNDVGNVSLVKCSFVGNKAEDAGGGLAMISAPTMVSHCEFRGNAAADGGGVYLYQNTLTVTESLFSGNTGVFGGGGIHVGHGWMKMAGCTLTGNSTYGQGGAIRVVNSQNSPYVYNTIIWNNVAGGSVSSPSASAYGPTSGARPYYENSLVANSGGSANWNWSVGGDGRENIDANPRFVAGIDPATVPTDAGNFALAAGSPALNLGNAAVLSTDRCDLDGDGDVGEAVPFDLAGNERVVSTSVDMGAYEFGDLNLIDGDGDGLSDAFELAHGELDPMSDNDGDGLTALAEFVHGLDPEAPLKEPVGTYAPMEYLGTKYMCMTFLVNPDALNFVNITVQRRGDLASPLGWLEGQTIVMSTVQSLTHPGMLEITCRSQVPFGQDGMEFMRLRHDPIVGGAPTP